MSGEEDDKSQPRDPLLSEQGEVRKVAGNFTGILAIIGAVAAIFTIYGFFNKNSPVVHAELRSSGSFIPEGSRVLFTPDEGGIWHLMEADGIKHYCNTRLDSGGINYYKDDVNCAKAKALSSKVDKSAGYGDKDVTRSVINLSNSGTDVASSLKIRLAENGRILVADQADKDLLNKDVATGDSIVLPDLNPSESLKITLDAVEGYPIGVVDRPVPTITYAKGTVSISQYRIVSPFFADMADLVRGLPLIIIIGIIVLVSFLITFSTILLVATANALIKGRTLSSAFQSNTSS